MRRFGCLALVVVSSAGLLAQDRGDQPTFKTGVELVQLDVTVLDGKRAPVRGLSLSDFTVLENGVPRPIRAFKAVELPSRAQRSEPTWAQTVPPDIATNQAAAENGRLVIILMDRSIPFMGGTVMAQKIALAAVDALGPNDLAALVSTSAPYAPQNFTADHNRLVKAIMQRDWSTESSLFPWSLDEGGDPRCFCGLCVLENVTQVSEAVREVPRRRKTLLFIGRGLVVNSPPRDPKLDPGCEHPLKVARQKLYDSLAVSNLTVHSIDPRGLENIGEMTKASVSGAGFDRPVNNGPQMRQQQLTRHRNDMARTQESLKILPARTGGRAVVNTNAPDEEVAKIFRESETYYLLGFERDPFGKSDERRDIEVKVARKDARAYAQHQYISPRPPASRETSGISSATSPTLTGGLLPNASTPLALGMTAFAKSDGVGALVNLDLDAAAFAGATPTPLDTSVVVVDQTGRQVGSAKQTSTLGIRPPSAERTAPVYVHTHLELDPGDYEVRVGVTDPKTGATGSVFSQIEIPTFATARLSVSDMALEVGRIQQTSDASGTPGEIRSTTSRVFDRDDQVRAFLQIYQGTGRTDPIVPVSVRVTIVDARGGIARDESLVFGEDDFRDRRADCRVDLPIAGLAAGEYLLEVASTARDEAAVRRVRFSVR
jgi:VWFA-related protein